MKLGATGPRPDEAVYIVVGLSFSHLPRFDVSRETKVQWRF